MAIKKRLIPFSFTPAAWGLCGRAYELAEIYYNYTDYDLEIKLNSFENCADEHKRKLGELNIRHKYNMLTDAELAIGVANLSNDPVAILEAKYQHGVITEKEHDYGIAEIRDDEGTWLGVKHKHGELTNDEFCKQMATLRGEPWVSVTMVDGSTGVSTGTFEMDWNSKFIENIRAEGFSGLTDEDCIDLWFTSIAKNIALAELSGTGIFDEQAEESYQLKKTRIGSGITEYK